MAGLRNGISIRPCSISPGRNIIGGRRLLTGGRAPVRDRRWRQVGPVPEEPDAEGAGGGVRRRRELPRPDPAKYRHHPSLSRDVPCRLRWSISARSWRRDIGWRMPLARLVCRTVHRPGLPLVAQDTGKLDDYRYERQPGPRWEAIPSSGRRSIPGSAFAAAIPSAGDLTLFAEGGGKYPFLNRNSADLSGAGDVTLEPEPRWSLFCRDRRQLRAGSARRSLRRLPVRTVAAGSHRRNGVSLLQPKTDSDIFGINVGWTFR